MMPDNLDKLTTAELEQRAISRHGDRAFVIACRLCQRSVPTRAGWIAALNAPVDEYAEASHQQWQASLREKFPWLS
jgi:hypothetical protein